MSKGLGPTTVITWRLSSTSSTQHSGWEGKGRDLETKCK
jgi:hypothetical protein